MHSNARQDGSAETGNQARPRVLVTGSNGLIGGFVMDDWRIRDNVTLSYGLRVEAQTNLDSAPKFAPRVALAWAPGSTAQTKRPRRVDGRGTAAHAGAGVSLAGGRTG